MSNNKPKTKEETKEKSAALQTDSFGVETIKNKRSPVVVVMGHIDHGKSTLLDFIRSTNTTEKEAGGITQHISAYEAVVTNENKERKITFIDTPGHEAFKSMRSTGGLAADIVILVVSAEDGVKPQTLEAIEWIQGHKLPFVVAFTKVDRPGANIDTAKQSLAEAGIYVEGYGGDIPWNAVSGKTGDGVQALLETILLIADLNNIHDENPEKTMGIIIESHRDPKKGVTATAIIKNGQIEKGEFAGTEGAFTPLRMLENYTGKAVDKMSAGSPIRIIGWSEAPMVGNKFYIFKDKESAINFAKMPQEEKNVQSENTGDKKTVAIIARADTTGSLKALVYEIEKFSHERVVPKIILSGIGNVGENDIKTAQSDKESLVVAFHTGIDTGAKSLAERLGITILSDDIIYKLMENINASIESRAPKITIEEVTGSGKIIRLFSKNKDKQIVGGKVTEGVVKLNAQVNIVRRENKIGMGRIKELQYLKERINEAEEGREFGAMIESKTEIAIGDIVQCFDLQEK